MKRSNRLAWIGAIALGVMVILSFFAAPTSSNINSGSTYNRAPDGYGAWYAYMEKQKTGIKRWQKPFSDFNTEKRATLLQINSQLTQPDLDSEEKKWLEKGNTLIILGVRDSVTAAEFTTMHKSPVGDVKIQTRRRRQIKAEEKVSLGDRFGAVVWEKNYGQGKAIFSTTPYLAANAYQDEQSNFQYLSDLVSQKGHVLFVDEYIHGYKEPSVRKREGEGNLLSYFTKTPVFPAFLQLLLLLLVLIWSQNRRFGKPVALDTQVVDNSEAYIKALAGVLQKAKSSDFVVEMLGKAEQRQLQRGDRVGVGVFDRQMHTWIPPERGQNQLSRLIERLTPIQPVLLESDYVGAVTRVVQQQTRRCLVVVITDLVDMTASGELLAALSRLTPRYLSFCVTLRDPLVDHLAHTTIASLKEGEGGVRAAYTRAVALDLLAQRQVAFAQLKHKGVLVLDAPANQITEQLVDKYLQIKARNLL